MESKHTISLGQFAIDFGLTAEQVVAELASGRLGFNQQGGERFTDRFAALDWAQRRALALLAYGIKGVDFPFYGCDIEFLEEANAAMDGRESPAAPVSEDKVNA